MEKPYTCARMNLPKEEKQDLFAKYFISQIKLSVIIYICVPIRDVIEISLALYAHGLFVLSFPH